MNWVMSCLTKSFIRQLGKCWSISSLFTTFKHILSNLPPCSIHFCAQKHLLLLPSESLVWWSSLKIVWLQMGPEDIRWKEDEISGIDLNMYLQGRGPPTSGGKKPGRGGPMPGPGRGRGFQKNMSKKDFPPPQNGVGKRSSDDIDILHTESLIKEVSFSVSEYRSCRPCAFLFYFSFAICAHVGGESF